MVVGKKLTDREVGDRISSFGWEWVDGAFRGHDLHIIVKCPNGHTMRKTLRKLLDHRFCRECERELMFKMAREVAIERDGELLSTKFIGAHDKYKWKCNKDGYVWEATYSAVVSAGHWCPLCRGGMRYTINVAKQVAIERGGECLSNKYVNSKTKLRWRCECGFEWNTALGVIMNGSWCPKCNSGNYITIDYVKSFAQSRGGECLSTKYYHSKEKLKFRCQNGHEWETSFNTVCSKRCWCPICSTPGKSQLKLFNILGEIFDSHVMKYNFRDFDWLLTHGGGKQEIDIWIPHLKLAIEYDGEQHFKPMRYGSKDKMAAQFEKIQERDHIKNEKMREHFNDVKYFVRISYKEKLIKDNIINILTNRGIPIGV